MKPNTPPRTQSPEDSLPPDESLDPGSLRAMVHDQAVLNYLFAGLAALAMVFVVMFQRGSDLGGLLLVLIGGPGLIFRKTAAPALFLVILTYFLIFPAGLPPAWRDSTEITNHFRVVDLILVASVLIYLAAHYRVFGLTTQALPFDAHYPRKGEKPARRPSKLVRTGEIRTLLFLVTGVVVVGQLAWWVVANVEPDPTATPPLKLIERQRGLWSSGGEGSEWRNRFVILAGMLAIGTLIARLVFGYWRLRTMSAVEAGMILQDTVWNETRREPSRQEAWRVWGRDRAAARQSPPPQNRSHRGASQ